MPTIAEVSWLRAGTEACSNCGQFYVYEMEARCSGCDAPLCPLCATEDESGDFSCPECEG